LESERDGEIERKEIPIFQNLHTDEPLLHLNRGLEGNSIRPDRTPEGENSL
jgi:hypothetical protein